MATALIEPHQTPGPRIASVSEHRLVAGDGTRLRIQRVRPADRVVATAVYLHGIASHGGWFVDTAVEMAAHGIETIAPDRRGSGRSGGERGHLDRVDDALDDIREVVNSAAGPVILVASSWAAKAAIVFAAREPSMVRGLVLMGPGLIPRVGLSVAERARVVFGRLMAPRLRIPIPLTPEHYTENPIALTRIREDPLRLLDATAGFFWATNRLDRWRARSSAALRVPMLLQIGARDAMMDVPATIRWLDTVPASDRTLRLYPDAAHTLDFEPDPSRYRADLVEWILDHA